MSFDGLFVEDFDMPAAVRAAPPRPERDEAAELAAQQALREAAYADGYRAGSEAIAAAQRERANALLASCEAQLRDAESAAGAFAEQAASAVARLLFQLLAKLLPATCTRFGAAEIAAFAREILPLIRHERHVAIRVNPHDMPCLDAVLADAPAALQGRVSLRPTDSVMQGDVRICWPDGEARRGAAEMWEAMAAALRPLGLFDEDQTQNCAAHQGS